MKIKTKGSFTICLFHHYTISREENDILSFFIIYFENDKRTRAVMEYWFQSIL